MKKSLLSAAGLTALFLTACGGADDVSVEEPENIIVATQLDANSPFAVGFERFQEVVEEESGGQLTVEVHTDGSLGGNEDGLLQSIATGAVDMSVISPGFMTQALREIDLFSMPYLFTSYEHWERAMDGEVGEELSQMIEDESDLRVMGYWTAGVRNYYGFSEVNDVEDLNNVSIRAQDSPAVLDAWQALGAIPTSVAWDEMYQALQNRVVDASENDFTNIYQSSHHEVAPYISLTEHDFTTRLFLTSEDFLENLSDEHEEIVRMAAGEATEAAREADLELAEESLENLQEEGAVVNDVDIEPFIEETEAVRERVAEELDAVELYEAIRDLADD